jgi:O-antigen/teichoic acid export membrane protein
LALVGLFSTMAKIVFRLKLDEGFFRIYYDLESEEQRRRLAGSVAVFAALVSTSLFALVVVSAKGIAALLFGAHPAAPRFIVLAAADIYLSAFAFVPLNLLRIQERSRLFSSFSIGRHVVNSALKVVLLMAGLGVGGALAADAAASGVYALALAPILVRNVSLRLSPRMLGEALSFSLPKIPHGILVQALNLADRKILDLFVSRAEVGLYQIGYTFGGMVKFPLSAFEPAWQPFVYAQIRNKNAPAVLARVVTYAFAAFLAAGLGLAVLGRDLLTLMTPSNPAFRAAAPVIPIVALGYLCHGCFLLTSIGIAIEKKPRYYPVITFVAAAINIGGNFLLIPSLGMLGAAWATVAGYAVMAMLGFVISQRLYPLPLETGRLARAAAVAGLVFALAELTPQGLGVGSAWRTLALFGYPAGLLASGFLEPAERERLRAWASGRARG